MFGDYSSYSEEYEELADASIWRRTRRRAGMKNKLSWFAVPYVVWMAIFVVAPIIMVVVYAFYHPPTAALRWITSSSMGSYTAVFVRSFKLAIIATRDLSAHRLSQCPIS